MTPDGSAPPPGGRPLDDLPPVAAFVHTDVQEGFEIVSFRHLPEGGTLLEGGTTGIEDGEPYSMTYRIKVDASWRTSTVDVTSISRHGREELAMTKDGGRWWIDGIERPDLDGCADVDLESSLVTNTLAIHRLGLDAPPLRQVPAAFVRTDRLQVERLEQTYAWSGPLPGGGAVFDYTSPTFGVECSLPFDATGLVIEYPALGRRYA